MGLTRRQFASGAAGSVLGGGLPRCARARAPKITLLTDWFAQAEHGGFYQAKATGLYEKAGLDVSITMGGTQVNTLQLLTGGFADIILGYDIQILKAVEKGLPVLTVGTAFQFDFQGVMTHTDINSIGELKGHKIQIASVSHTTFWPWLKQKYGFTDDMIAMDSFNMEPFLHDPTLAVQGIPSSEPYLVGRLGMPTHFFLFADEGYPPYGGNIVTTQRFAADHPDWVAAFVRASMLGYIDYFRNPAPGNALIQRDNPRMSDDRIAFAIAKMKEIHALDRGDGAKLGVGTMTAARWQATKDFLVKYQLINPAFDVKTAYTTRFTDGLHIFG
jgi:NitT/TauT family transport system substrate-binding protein